MTPTLPARTVVLLGIGHTNAHVLRMWKMHPIPDAQLICVTNFFTAAYSGMLPGTLAGLYPPHRMEIDLVRLCAAANARLIKADVSGIDVPGRRLLFHDRPPLPFDVLSVGVGSQPVLAPILDARGEMDSAVVPIKPMQTFVARLSDRLHAARFQVESNAPMRLAVVGGGAAGIEIALCLSNRIKQELGHDYLHEITLIDRHDRLGLELPPAVGRRVAALFAKRGIHTRLGRDVTAVRDGAVIFSDRETAGFDVILWAVSAKPLDLLALLDLPRDERGFLLTRETLQTVADAPIFAVGDTGSIENVPLPKAGVYAVRQGPILWENIRRQLRGKPLIAYRPQRDFLKLLATGDRRAILIYRGATAAGRWCWNLKDRIDGQFMDMYQDYSPMPRRSRRDNNRNGTTATGPAMRCVGCGGKVGGSVLSRVLHRLDIPRREHVLLGLDAPDDAAVIAVPGGRPMTVTVDFFASPLNDPFLVGRIAALNAASDVFAMGATPLGALAMASIPVGPERAQEEWLYELMAGALVEFNRMDAPLIGGHTIEGPQTMLGFTVLADSRIGTTGTAVGTGDRPAWRAKSGLRVGDRLVLTKPLGVGALLAAHMTAQCRAEWFGPLLDTMLGSNRFAAELADEFDIHGITDITGFGLLGHLLEMLRASHVGATLDLDAIPLLPGAAELFSRGIESTIAPANRAAAESAISVSMARRSSAAFAALFDPQTSGGLLLGVSAAHVDAVLHRLTQASAIPAATIGEVTALSPSDTDSARVRLLPFSA